MVVERVYPWFRMTPNAPVSRTMEKVAVYMWNQYGVKLEFGLLPKAYNFKKHGPYVPYRHYSEGAPDTTFANTTINDLPAWFGRRDKSIPNMHRAVGRAWYFWAHRFRDVHYRSMTWYWQFLILSALLLYVLKFDRHEKFRVARYHW